jgi:steroid 5-alpha reductase family enzyme
MDWISSQLATLPGLTPWLLGVALAISALGFYRVVYFVSIGYAFSIFAMAVITAIALSASLTLPVALQIGLLVAWGLRLGVYLVLRERRSAYRRQLEDNQSYDRRVALPKRIPIWVGVSLLYVAMFSPALFGAADARQLAGLPLVIQAIGLLVMALGLALEAVADAQKSAAKTACPNCFTNVGLYRWVRCPNYLGEITFWTGSLIAGAAFLASALQVVVALAGWVCIVLIMMGSTKRLERTQEARYGQQPAYQEYVRTVPLLFPWVPLYTLQGVRVYLE